MFKVRNICSWRVFFIFLAFHLLNSFVLFTMKTNIYADRKNAPHYLCFDNKERNELNLFFGFRITRKKESSPDAAQKLYTFYVSIDLHFNTKRS